MPERVLKWIGVALLALLALLVVCGLLLRLLFDPDDHRASIEAAFGKRTGRVLELEGELGLKLLPRLAVSTGPFSISNRAGFGAQPFLAAQDARLGLALLPLLRRRIELGEIVLHRPVAALRIDANGRDNWSDLLDRLAPSDPSDDTEPQPIAETGDPVDLSIPGLRIVNGSLSLEDARKKSRLRLENLNLKTGPLDFETPTPVEVRFDLMAGESRRLHAELSGRIARATRRSWTMDDFVGEMALLPEADAAREPVRGRIEAAQLRAELDTRRYFAPDLRYAIADARGQASLEVQAVEGGFELRGPVSLERTDLRKLLTDLGARPPALKDPKALGALELEAAVRWDKGIVLQDVVAVLDDTKLTGSARFGTSPAAPVRFDLKGDRLDLDRYLPTAARSAQAAAAPAKASASGAAGTRLRAFDIEGRLAFARLTLARVELRDLDGSIALRDGQLRLDPLRATVFGGSSLTRLRYELARATPKLDFEQRLENVDTASMLGQLANQRRLSGRGSLTAHLTGQGHTAKSLIAGLTGPFEARVVDGRFEGVDLWAEIERAVAAARGAAAPRPAGPAHTQFDLFEAQGRIAGRSIENDRFHVANSFLRAQGKGMLNYGTGALDLGLTARLLQVPADEIAGLNLDGIVGVDIPLTIRGTVSEPRVRPDVSRLLESAAKQRLREEGEKVEKKLKDKLGETLKDLLGQ